jgi:hypothetical protein
MFFTLQRIFYYITATVVMEADKENIHRLKRTTKIPLPLEPLPAVPKHLLEKNTNKKSNVDANNPKPTQTRIPLPLEPLPSISKAILENNKQTAMETNERYPLRTLNLQHNLALPSTSHPKHVEKVLNIDTRFVTRRQRSEELDWDFKIFKDTQADESVIVISSDEDSGSKKDEYRYFAQSKRRSELGDAKDNETPKCKSLEPNRVRNIKRSLKRPHSRELQGLSPKANTANSRKCDEKVKRKLYFNEPLQDRLSSPDFCKYTYVYK